MDKMINMNSDQDSFITMKKWMENKNAGKTFVDYFHSYGYKKIGIYGAGDVGKLLYEEIKNSDIGVTYFVDRNAEGIQKIEGVPVIMIQDIEKMNKVDCLVITPLGNYNEICKVLVNHVPELPTLSMRDAVYEI